MKNFLLGISIASIVIAIGLFGLTVGASLKAEVDIAPWEHILFKPAVGCFVAGLLVMFLIRPLRSR